MRITKDQLQALIDEEVSRILLRRENRTLIKKQAKFLKESYEDLECMSLDELLSFCKAYSSLGRAMQEQLHALVSDPGIDANPNAINILQSKLGGKNPELDKVFEEWHRAYD